MSGVVPPASESQASQVCAHVLRTLYASARVAAVPDAATLNLP